MSWRPVRPLDYKAPLKVIGQSIIGPAGEHRLPGYMQQASICRVGNQGNMDYHMTQTLPYYCGLHRSHATNR